MFQCSVCRQTIGPGVKANKVVSGTRNAAYHNEFFVEDEWGNKEKREVDSVGTEITGEQLTCDQCIGIVAAPALPTLPRGPQQFQEKLAKPLHVKMIADVAHTGLDRVQQSSKRAERDSMVAVPLVKWFVDNNKDLVF